MYDPSAQYCGPGPLTVATTPSTNANCYIHDGDYKDMMDNGIFPYFVHNDADDRFISRLEDDPNAGFFGTMAKYLFQGKKYAYMSRRGGFFEEMQKQKRDRDARDLDKLRNRDRYLNQWIRRVDSNPDWVYDYMIERPRRIALGGSYKTIHAPYKRRKKNRRRRRR